MYTYHMHTHALTSGSPFGVDILYFFNDSTRSKSIKVCFDEEITELTASQIRKHEHDEPTMDVKVLAREDPQQKRRCLYSMQQALRYLT